MTAFPSINLLVYFVYWYLMFRAILENNGWFISTCWYGWKSEEQWSTNTGLTLIHFHGFQPSSVCFLIAATSYSEKRLYHSELIFFRNPKCVIKNFSLTISLNLLMTLKLPTCRTERKLSRRILWSMYVWPIDV